MYVLMYAPLLIWIGVIFYLSSDSGAMTETSRFIRPILEFIFPTATESTLNIYHGYIRKFAHFAVYAVLAFLASRAFFNRAGTQGRKYWHLYALGLSALVGTADEINQSLGSTRTGSFWDVVLDVSGAIFAVAIYWLFVARRTKAGRSSSPPLEN